MTNTQVTPLDQQGDCTGEWGTKHAFILLSGTHSETGIYGCQRCPEVRLGADVDMVPISYHVTADRNVARLMFGEHYINVTQRPVGLDLAIATAAALNDAVRRGAAHGLCDKITESDNAWEGKPTPGHVTYEAKTIRSEDDKDDFGKGVVLAQESGTATPIITDVRPVNFAKDFAFELGEAFLLGSLVDRVTF